MSHTFHIRASQFAAALTVALASLSQAPAYAFAPCTPTTPKTLEFHNVRSMGTSLKAKHKLGMITSFAEVDGASKRMPVFVDFDHGDLDRTNFTSLQEANCQDENRHFVDTSLSEMTESPPDPPLSKEVWVARLLLLLSAALYGTNFTMVKSLDESLSVGISSTLRFGFAALCMLPWLLAPIDDQLKSIAKEKFERCKSDMSKWEEPTRLAAGLAGMEIGVYNSIGYISQAIGLKTIPANKSAFICSMAVVTVPILDFLFGKVLLKRQVLGACLAAIGVYALEMGGQDASSLSSGDLVSLVQPLMFGLGFWRMEAAMEKYPTEAGRLAAAQLLMVFLVSLSYLICGAPFTDTCEVLPSLTELVAWFHDPSIMGMLVWTGLITTAFTIWMETLALKTLSAAETTLIFSTEPLFGAAFAAAVAGECFGREAGIGAAFIIGGCLVSGLDLDAQIKKLLPRN